MVVFVPTNTLMRERTTREKGGRKSKIESMFLGIVFARAIDEANEKISVSRGAKSSGKEACAAMPSVQTYIAQG